VIVTAPVRATAMVIVTVIAMVIVTAPVRAIVKVIVMENAMARDQGQPASAGAISEAAVLGPITGL
jgi:hypothetical protein